MLRLLVAGRTGTTLHRRSALSAVELACQPEARDLFRGQAVRPLAALPLVQYQPLLRGFKYFLGDDSGHTVGRYNIAIAVLSDICAVVQNMSKGIDSKGLPAHCGHTQTV